MVLVLLLRTRTVFNLKPAKIKSLSCVSVAILISHPIYQWGKTIYVCKAGRLSAEGVFFSKKR